MAPRLPGVLAAAMLLTPVVVLLGCAGFGVSGDREGKYLPEPDPSQRVAEAVVAYRRFGYPVVRMEVDHGVTRVRCAQYSVTVHEPRIVK